MKIHIEYQNVRNSINIGPRIKKLLRAVVKEEGKKLGDISVILTNNNEILKINRKFLNHSYYTDVITFPLGKRDTVSGDIYISLEQVLLNSEKYKTEFFEETIRVIIHGILHLIGYNDMTNEEKTIMRKKEDHYLCRLKEFGNSSE